MRSTTAALISLVTLWSIDGVAATTHRTAVVERIQADSHTRVGYEDTFWIMFSGSWPGTNCGPDWVWFNAKENPQFVATVLLAKATGASLQVYVDDALPKKDSRCQAYVVSM